ncbi:Rap1a/Tai family immunity protein [Neptunomonas japonica]|uniref:Rap1a immunity protein domain-containing protein n=1 Tax=Neptunomonas japonica JAMM 1380 TaxID=1441457 RepID=A0A7R6PGF7_9GAMM|nr:Rap1a/Tai family immunity protein [Neptunomonas japonica]BBB29153.1 hypothetical protein NEJAP_1200 [Neptunomonas japonica JAMM 1380]
MRKAISLFIFISLFSSAQAFAISAQQFYDKCHNINQSKSQETPSQAVTRALEAGSCTGYVGGVINGVNLVGNMLGQQKAVKKNFICLTKNTQIQELLYESLQYIKEHEKLSDAPVQISIYNAMTANYPCTEFSTHQ